MDADPCDHIDHPLSVQALRPPRRFGLGRIQFHPAEKVTSTSRRLAEQITTDHDRLELIWRKLGPSIISKWKGFGLKKRQDILEGICPRRRPELEIRSPLMLDPNTHRAFLHPHLNVEDLAEGDNLLTLLKARALSTPGRFAAFDLQNANIPLIDHDARPDGHFADQVMHLPADDQEQYGSIQAGSGPDNHSTCQADFGLLILEAQSDIYALLPRLAQVALGSKADFSSAALLKMKDAKSRKNDVSTEVDSSGSLQSAIARAPLCLPPEPDFELLEDLAASKLDAAIHHVVHLRESPPYFKACMQKWASHLFHDQRDKNYDVSRWLMILNAYQMVWLWNVVLTALQALRGSTTFTKVDMLRYQSLKDALDDLMTYSSQYIAEGVPLAKCFRTHLVRTREAGDGDDKQLINDYYTGRSASEYEERLFDLFYGLCVTSRSVLGAHNLAGEIDKLLSQGQGRTRLFDAWLDERFADLQAVTQVQAQSKLWQSRVSVPEDVKADASNRARDRQDFRQDLMNALGVYCALDPLDPHDERLANTSNAEESETDRLRRQKACDFLEDWWRGLNIKLNWVSDDGAFGQLNNSDGEPLSPAWAMIMDAVSRLKPLCKVEEDIEKTSKDASGVLMCGQTRDVAAKSVGVASIDRSMHWMHIGRPGSSGPTTGREILKNHASTKDKRDGQRPPFQPMFGPLRPLNMLAGRQQDDNATEERIHVSKKDLAIFQVIFGDGRNGQITFEQLRQAMNATGFDSRQLGSSAFIFQHRERKLRSIQFHINHGTQDTKINRSQTRYTATRLTRVYGWTAETFAEK